MCKTLSSVTAGLIVFLGRREHRGRVTDRGEYKIGVNTRVGVNTGVGGGGRGEHRVGVNTQVGVTAVSYTHLTLPTSSYV